MKRLELERNQFDEITILRCPHCRGNNLHHFRVRVFDRHEDDVIVVETTVQSGLSAAHRIPSEDSRNPSSRRHGLAIDFVCENCGDTPKPIVLTVAQHKGSTHVAWGDDYLDPPHMVVRI